MTFYDILHQGNPVTITIVDRYAGMERAVTATPVITLTHDEILAGLHYSSAEAFCYWAAPRSANLIEAWRTVQLLEHLKVLFADGSYSETVDDIDRAVRWQNSPVDELLAESFGLNVDELTALVDRVRNAWPSPFQLGEIWNDLPERQQDEHVALINDAIDNGHIARTEGITQRLEEAQARIDEAQAQLDEEARRRQHDVEMVSRMLNRPDISTTPAPKRPPFSVIRGRFTRGGR